MLFYRDIAKNSLLRWPIFVYWTVLGVYDAVVMFFGAYFLFDNTSFTSNGQVSSVHPTQSVSSNFPPRNLLGCFGFLTLTCFFTIKLFLFFF